MRLSTLAGMGLGLAMLLAAIGLTAHDPTMFLNGAGAIIVLGGTLAATLMSYSVREIAAAFASFLTALRSEEQDKRRDLSEALQIARVWHNGDVHGAEARIRQAHSPLLRTGLQMAVDGAPIDQILEVLDWRIARERAKEMAEAEVFQAMGNYAPAFGMVGTLLGLVNMLNDMGEAAVQQIAVNLAVALITTFYGLVLANVVFKPMAVKLRRRVQDRLQLLNLIKEVVVLVSHNQSPAQLKYTLESFLRAEHAGAVPEDPAEPAATGGSHRAA